MISITDTQTGREFRSISAAARSLGISKDGLRYRLARFSPELRFFPGRIPGIYSRDHTGRDFPTIAAMARAWGMRPRLVADRLRRGWDMERALTAPHGSRI